MDVYKIRNKEGLFSNGGATPKFKKWGKCWVGIGPLKNHLAMLIEYKVIKIYKECEVVKLSYNPLPEATMVNFIGDYIEKRTSQEIDRSYYRKDEKIAEYHKIKKEFGLC